MYYITVDLPKKYKQMTIWDLLGGSDNYRYALDMKESYGTKTYCVEKISDRFASIVDVNEIINSLKAFNEATQYLRDAERHSLYREFHIPKRSGGLRKIDAPNEDLMAALRRLKAIFEEECHAKQHTSAFAYVRGRSTIDAIKRHQANESKWFAKYDLSNFFGSTTKEFVIQQFGMVFPFCKILEDEVGKVEFERAIDLAFLDGGLPQGTPISPLITNIMMIPVDFKLYNGFRQFKFTSRDGEEKENYCVYTRYADDFQVSSKYDFDFAQAEKFIADVLGEFNAPFKINSKKTRYGSSSGSNWNLGLMLNKDNNITVGHKNKKKFQAMINNFVLDTKNGKYWDLYDIQVLEGLRNYYSMIEKESINLILSKIGEKYHVDVKAMLKTALKGN